MFPRHKNIVSTFISMFICFYDPFFFSCNSTEPGETVSESANTPAPAAGELDRTVLPIYEPHAESLHVNWMFEMPLLLHALK